MESSARPRDSRVASEHNIPAYSGFLPSLIFRRRLRLRKRLPRHIVPTLSSMVVRKRSETSEWNRRVSSVAVALTPRWGN